MFLPHGCLKLASELQVIREQSLSAGETLCDGTQSSPSAESHGTTLSSAYLKHITADCNLQEEAGVHSVELQHGAEALQQEFGTASVDAAKFCC